MLWQTEKDTESNKCEHVVLFFEQTMTAQSWLAGADSYDSHYTHTRKEILQYTLVKEKADERKILVSESWC